MNATPKINSNNSAVIIHGAPWEIAHVIDGVAMLIGQSWQREKWFSTPALVHKKGGVTTQYKGKKYDSEKIDLVPNGWNHDHCAICFWTLHESNDPDEGTGYHNDSNVWLCSECYDQFIHKDILQLKPNSEQADAGNRLSPVPDP